VINLRAFLSYLELSAWVKVLALCLVAQTVFLIFSHCRLNSSRSLVCVFLAVLKDLMPRLPWAKSWMEGAHLSQGFPWWRRDQLSSQLTEDLFETHET